MWGPQLRSIHLSSAYQPPTRQQISCSSTRRSMIPDPLACHLPNGLQNDHHISSLILHSHFFFPQTTYLHTHHHSCRSFDLIHVGGCPSTCHRNGRRICRTWCHGLAFGRITSRRCIIYGAYSLSRLPSRCLGRVACWLAIRLNTCCH